MMTAYNKNKKIRLLVFGIFAAGLTRAVILLTPPVRSLLGMDKGDGASRTECRELSGVKIASPACCENFDNNDQYQYIPELNKKAIRLGSFDTSITMGDFVFQLGNLYADFYNLNDIDYSFTLSMPVRFTHSGTSDGFGEYTPNYNLLLILTGMKKGEILYNAALQFKPAYDYDVQEPEYYKADLRFNSEGKMIPLAGDNPPWETRSAEMVLMRQLLVSSEKEIAADRIVIRYAALRTQTCERAFTVYDKNSDSFSRNDYSIDDDVYGLAEEDDFGTRYIVAKNADNVYFQLIDPAYFSEEKYRFITAPAEDESASEKYSRIFKSVVPVTYD